MASAPITFGNGYENEYADIERKRAMAKALSDQANEVRPTEVVNGWAVKQSKYSGLAKALQAAVGMYGNYQANQDQKALSTKMQDDLANTLRDATAAQTGTPAKTTVPATPNDDEGNAMPAPATPAVAPNPGAAAAIYLKNPQTQQLGLTMAQTAAEQARKQAQFQMMTGMGGAPAAPAPPAGAPGAVPPASGAPAPQGAAPGFDANGVPVADVQRFAVMDDPLAAYQKHVEELHKPKMSANGQVVQYQRLPDGSWGYAPGAGAVAAAQQFANVLSPKDQQAMDLQALEQFDKTGKDLPGYAQGKRTASPAGAPAPAQYLGPQPNGRFQGDANAVAAQIAAIKDPAERAAAAQALRNQVAGTNPNPEAAAAAGGAVPIAPATPATRLGPQLAPAAQRDVDKKMGEELNQLGAKELFEGYKTSQKAADQLSSIQESRKAVAGGAFQGAGAGAKTDVAKFAKGLFGIDLDPTKTTNAEYLRSTLGSQVLNQAKALGSNPSNTDAKRIEEIVGNIDKDPGALDKILDWQEQMVRKAVAQHNGNVDQMEKRGYKSPFDLRVQLAEPLNLPARRESDKTPVRKWNPQTGKIE